MTSQGAGRADIYDTYVRGVNALIEADREAEAYELAAELEWEVTYSTRPGRPDPARRRAGAPTPH
jgi:hypothetical protein